MPDPRIWIDDVEAQVAAGSTVAAALALVGDGVARRSVSGEPRSPLCGMGVCHECRVEIDGMAQQRACMIAVRDGMRVRTHAFLAGAAEMPQPSKRNDASE